MSLTFQLARGAFALSLFAALSIAAWLAPAPATATRVILVDDAGTVAIVCPLPPPALRLASAPADLPGRRLATICRA